MDDAVTAEQIELNERTPLVDDGGNQRGDEADAGAAGDMQQAQPSPQVPCSVQNGLDEPGHKLDQVQYFKGEIDRLKRDYQEPESYKQAVQDRLKECIFAERKSKLNDEEATGVFGYIEKDVLRYAFSHEEAGRWFAEVVQKNQWQDAAGVVLSSMMEENEAKRTWMVHYNLLEAQIRDDNSGCTVYQLLATEKKHEDLINHDVCRLLTYDKWNKLKCWCIGSFVSYLVITFFLTYVLVTSGMAQKVLTYDSALDHSRGAFEMLSIISMFVCLFIEVVQIFRSRQHYFKDVCNWLELLSAVLLLCVTVPLRFGAEQYHWYFFALGYLIWIGLIYKHGILVKKFYIQAAVFVQVVRHDVGWFLMLFFTVNLAFSGSYYLILKAANDLYVNGNVTSTAPGIFFIGLRTLAEAQPVTEYTEEYSWVSVILMVVFLFVVCVLLVNLLIAQLSKTLDNVGETMDRRYQMKLAYTLAWLELNLKQMSCFNIDLLQCSKCCMACDDDGKMMLERTYRDLQEHLYQPVSATEKIFKKTKNLEQHQKHMCDVLSDTRSILSKTEQQMQQIPELEKSLGDKVDEVKKLVVDSFKQDISQALNNMQNFPVEAKGLLNEMKEHMQKAITGGTVQYLSRDKADAKRMKELQEINCYRAPDKFTLTRDKAKAKRFQSPTYEENIMPDKIIPLDEVKRIGAMQNKENEIDETDTRIERSSLREDENWSELEEEWEIKMKPESQEPQERILAFIEGCRLRNCNPATWLVQEKSPLVVATERGHYQVVQLLLDLLGAGLSHTDNKILALDMALSQGHDHTAQMLVNNISDRDPSRIMNCFFPTEDQTTIKAQAQPTVQTQAQPPVQAHAQLQVQEQAQPPVQAQAQLPVQAQAQLPVQEQAQPPVQAQAQLPHQAQAQPPVQAQAQPPVQAQAQPTEEAKVKLTEKYFGDNYLKFWLALLDAMKKDGKVSTKLFKQKILGTAPNENKKTIFQFLADKGNTTVFSHRVMQFLVEKKWKAGWRNQFLLDFVMYMFTLVSLTVAVCKSATAADVTSYHGSDDAARLVFEIFSMILLLYAIVKEGWELKREGFRSYWSDHFNKAECFSVLLLLVVTIPLRFTVPRAHWYPFALGYLLWVLIIFKYSTFNREYGTYAQSLWTIVTTDVLYFMTLFAVVNLALSGAFFLVLKGDGNIHVNNETSHLGEVLFIGLRMLTDGQNSLNYYGSDGGYNSFMSVATIVVFLFVVIVLLANILIAQLSNTYTNVQEEARGAAWARKAKTIARLERATWWQCCPCACLKGREWQDEEKADDFHKYFPLEKNITTKIDDNVVSLMKKLPAIETNVAGLKVQTDRCKENLNDTKKRVVDDVNSLTSDLKDKVKTLTGRIEDIINIKLDNITELIDTECQEIKSKIDDYVVKELNECKERLKQQYAEKEESLEQEYKDRLKQMKHDLDKDKPQD